MAAIEAKNEFNDVILLERNSDVLKKLLMTGNGRCNYYHENQELFHYHSQSGDVSSFITRDNIEKYLSFMNKMGVIPKIKNGYYYPNNYQASSIRDDFIHLLEEKNIDVRCNYCVKNISKKNDTYIINDEIVCDYLVISTGSFAYPKTGSDGMGYSFLKSLSHRVITPFPSLVALKSNRRDMKYFSGVRADVCLSLIVDGELLGQELGEVQFTDYGISGICTFNLSYDANHSLSQNKKVEIQIDFLPDIENPYSWLLEYSKKTSYSVNRILENILPKKIVPSIVRDSNVNGDLLFEELSEVEKDSFIYVLTHFVFPITGSLDYEHSQVCGGGVSLEEVDFKTCESKKHSHLYITGGHGSG